MLRINDTNGHVIGDKVLKDVAELISDSIRKDTDWVGRYGGEEFLIVLNNTEGNDALKVAEKIRRSLENTNFIYDNLTIKITSSFGVYCVKNKEVTVDELIFSVDKNLYEAKNTGRNKIVG